MPEIVDYIINSSDHEELEGWHASYRDAQLSIIAIQNKIKAMPLGLRTQTWRKLIEINKLCGEIASEIDDDVRAMNTKLADASGFRVVIKS